MVIRMISGGFGLTYTDGNGTQRFSLKTPSSGYFEAPDELAEELVKAGRAVAKKLAAAPAALPEAQTVEEDEDGPDLSVSDVVLPKEEPKRTTRKRKK